jgi:uncharacterized protein
MLFGSYARGDADEGSDLDLLVIETDVPDKAEEYLTLHRAIGSIGVDVLIMLNAGDKSSQKRDIRRAVNLAAELGEDL